MSDLINFQQKKEEQFTKKMNEKNDAFFKEYSAVGDVYLELEEKWLGDIGPVFERRNKKYQDLFNNDEQQFQLFCGELLETLNITEVPKEFFTFAEYNLIGSVTHKVAAIQFRKKYGNRFD